MDCRIARGQGAVSYAKYVQKSNENEARYELARIGGVQKKT